MNHESISNRSRRFYWLLYGKALVAQGCEVVGLDNINSYYDVQLKYDRLADTGITKESIEKDILLPSAKYPSYRFIKMDLTDREGLTNLFKDEHFDIVVNLAAQAGVRYSIEILMHILNRIL